MQSLSESDDMGLFDTTAIKKLIEFQWPIILKYTINYLFIPYAVFLCLFSIYMMVIFDTNTTQQIMRFVLMGCLGSMAVYLLSNEIFEVLKQGASKYFKDYNNFFDITPPIFILVIMYFDLTSITFVNEYKTTKACMEATVSLLVWLKFLYILRIFKSLSYLIRIVIQVCIDMKFFLLLLCLTFMAFGESIQALSKANEVSFTGSLGGFGYVYRMVLGDFSTD